MLIGFNETAEYTLKHPITGKDLKDKKGNPMVAVIYGKQSSQYKNASAAMIRAVKEKNEEGEESTDVETASIKLIASCVKEFKNLSIEYEEGKYLDPNNIEETLQIAFWIKDQLNREIVNLSNFSMVS